MRVVSLMEVGDSVLLDCKDTKDNLVHGFRKTARIIGFKLTAQTCNDGVRVWRVK